MINIPTLNKKNITIAGTLLMLVVGIPLAVIMSQQNQDIRQRASGSTDVDLYFTTGSCSSSPSDYLINTVVFTTGTTNTLKLCLDTKDKEVVIYDIKFLLGNDLAGATAAHGVDADLFGNNLQSTILNTSTNEIHINRANQDTDRPIRNRKLHLLTITMPSLAGGTNGSFSLASSNVNIALGTSTLATGDYPLVRWSFVAGASPTASPTSAPNAFTISGNLFVDRNGNKTQNCTSALCDNSSTDDIIFNDSANPAELILIKPGANPPIVTRQNVGSNGSYSFANVTPGTYVIRAAPLSGSTSPYVFQETNPINVVNADIRQDAGINLVTASPTSSPTPTTVPISISGRVYIDRDRNNEKDCVSTICTGTNDDWFFPHSPYSTSPITVTLIYNDGDNIGETVPGQQISSPNGQFTFSPVLPGQYVIRTSGSASNWIAVENGPYTVSNRSVTGQFVAIQPALPTATPTPTAMPTATPGPTSTPVPNSTQLAFTLNLGGIPAGKTILKPQRDLVIQLFDAQDRLVGSALNRPNAVTYSNSTGKFTGNVSIGEITPGVYSLKVKTDRYLNKRVAGIVTIPTGAATVTVPETTMVVGDINGDNEVNITDYNALVNCFANKKTSSSCVYAQAANLNDDTRGDVDEFDYNLLLRSFAIQNGD